MPRSWLIAALLILPLGACDSGPDRDKQAQVARPTLSIQQTDPDPAPTTAAKGKLAVLPGGAVPAKIAPTPRPQPVATNMPPAPRPEPQRVAELDPDRWDDPRFDDRGRGPDLQPPSPRDCRRAERRGEPLGDSPFCRDLLGGERLAGDCAEARDSGDDYGWSRQCRRVLGE